MTDTTPVLGTLDGVSARATLTQQAITIRSFDGSRDDSFPLSDVPRVHLQWPWKSDGATRNGFLQVVRPDDPGVGGALALYKDRSNILEIGFDQLQAAIDFSAQVERALPNPDRAFRPVALTQPASSPAPVKRPTTSTSTPASVPTTPARSSQALPSYSTPPVVPATRNPELERIGARTNRHLGTIAAGVALLASITVWTFWFWFAVGFLAGVSSPDADEFGLVTWNDVLSPGRVFLAVVIAIGLTWGSWKIARAVLSIDD